MDLLTLGLLALAAIVIYVIATHSSKKTETVVAEAPYKVETPVPAGDVAPQPIVVEGAGAVAVPAKKAAKPKAEKAKAKAPAKAPAKKPAAAKKAPAKAAPAKKAAKPKATKAK